VSVPAANNLRALASDAPDLAASYAVTIAADLGGMTVLDGVLAEHLRNEKNKEVGE
jgi:hypothetical protein